MKTIEIYIAYNERRNQLTRAAAEVVTELPAIGDITHGGQYVIDQIQKIDPDAATFSRDEACDYDFFWVHEADASGDPDYADEDNERYLAIRKEDSSDV